MHSTVTIENSGSLYKYNRKQLKITKVMFQLSVLIITKAIKVFGISSALYDVYFSLFSTMGINISLLFYTLAIEALFVYLKSTPLKVPIWVEAIEDFI